MEKHFQKNLFLLKTLFFQDCLETKSIYSWIMICKPCLYCISMQSVVSIVKILHNINIRLNSGRGIPWTAAARSPLILCYCFDLPPPQKKKKTQQTNTVTPALKYMYLSIYIFLYISTIYISDHCLFVCLFIA